jgi:hypothetical protein
LRRESAWKVPSSALLEHSEYQLSRPIDFEVFDLKNILPMLLLVLMAVTAGTLIVGHAVSTTSKVAKTSNVADNDDVQAGDQNDGQVGDTDDGNVEAGDTDASTAQSGTQGTAGTAGTADTQDGPNDDATTGDQVEDTSDSGVTGTSDVATMVEQAIAF